MAQTTIYETGDSLEALAEKARHWFITNNVEVPSGCREWQARSVRRGEIPPGTGITSLRRYGFNVTEFISAITGSGKKAYKIILKYLPEKCVIRQEKYDKLFNTGTKHTADFYIPSLNLVLEVTSSANNLGQKYKDTMEWKLSLSNMVKFAYSLKEVEDIVRSAMKVAEVAVDHSRSLLRRSTER